MQFVIYIILAVSAVIYIKQNISRRGVREEKKGATQVADGRVHEIVRAAYLDLKRQGVSGCGPWLSSLLETSAGAWCVGKTNKGRAVVVTEPMSIRADVALTAVRWTIQELTGSRYDLTALYEAEKKLEAIVA